MNDETRAIPSDGIPPTGSMSEVSEAIGSQIGPYKLLQEIGEGGMGTVYLAQQEKPIKRRVALKVIKPGMDSKQVVARFEAERQALSMMDHQNIAHVLDVGTTNKGLPFFVMELIKGLPITRYCDDKRLKIGQRLELFKSVCSAVQHAHQKGIIHRDLKPSNILVAAPDGKPVVKIIDFGLAKAMHHQLSDKTMFTQLGQIVGTLEYMSPEQSTMNQMEVDTRTDIYSLGVLLYELLTGTVPFDKKRLRSIAMDEVLKIIREEDPPKPSLRMGIVESSVEIAARRDIEPKRLGFALRGELDWIVMKALEKDRERRYETANGLAMDVQRFLDDETVRACPPSAGYQLKKFAKRNKVAIVTVSIVSAALVLGIIGTAWQAIQATNQRNRALKAESTAKTEAAISKAVNDFLNNDLLAQARPSKQPDRDIKLSTVLDLASESIEGRFEDQPLVEAAIRGTVAEAYWELGVYEKSERHYRRRSNILKQELGSENLETLDSLYKLTMSLDRQNKFAEAEKLQRQMLEIYDKYHPPEHMGRLNNLNGLGNSFWARGRIVESLDLYEEAAKIAKLKHPNHPRIVTFLMNEAWGTEYLGRYAEAEEKLREIDALAAKGGIQEFSRGTGQRICLARTLWRQGKLKESEELYRGELKDMRQLLGSDHPDVLNAMTGLARVLNSNGDYDEAEGLVHHVLDIQPRTIGPDNFNTLISLNTYAWTLSGQGKYVEAEQKFRDVLGKLEKQNYKKEFLDTQDALNGIARALEGQGRYTEAEKYYRELLEVQNRFFGPVHSDSLVTKNNLKELLAKKNKNPKSEISDDN